MIVNSKRRYDLLALQFHLPYLMASAYVLIVSTAIAVVFPSPPPRFMDVYLIGIAVAHWRWSAGPAWLIYFLSLIFSAFLLPPHNSVLVTEGHDIYRMVSYTITAVVVMRVIESLKSAP
jgi:K+-sensing histidine kinase KdpD